MRALIAVESAWRADAVSPAGAVGLMQLMPSTAADLWPGADLYDPCDNIAVGTLHMASLVRRYGYIRALGAWNAGEGAMRRGRPLQEYPETRAFMLRVVSRLTGWSVADLEARAGRRR